MEQKATALEQELSGLKRNAARRGIRLRSSHYLLGLPLYDVAFGPDWDQNEVRGHACGIIAVGDVATGFLALGGVARGFIALGGVALGTFAVGGCSLAIFVGLGGFAVGALALGGLAIGLVAVGGVAIGGVAVGGGAIGYYACGDCALGKYVISGLGHDPEAIRFFGQWIPAIHQLLQPSGH